MKSEHLGFAGNLGKLFITSKLTPVIIFASILLGIFAVYFTPKEEEPQISVPMIDIQTPAPGFTAEETERKVTEPIERAVWGLEGVEYVYSSSQAHGSLVTVRFKVGEPMEPSLVKVHHKLMALHEELPSNVQRPQVKSYSIDDVPFLVLTFTSSELDDYEIRSQVAPLARVLSSTPDLSRVEILGGRKRAVRVIAQTDKLRQYGVSVLDLAQTLQANDALAPSGKNWGEREVVDVEVGGRLQSSQDVENLAVGQRAGRVVFIKDVAQVVDGPEERVRSSVLLEKGKSPQSAVSIIFAKRSGTNVVTLSQDLLNHTQSFLESRGKSDIQMSILRDYGATAAEKSNELIEHLILATISVSILIALFMGIRASLVVAIAIPVTLALTLAIYYFMGYTLNRVTLFALIFSIGILVDDAIVVVENIERHLRKDASDGFIKTTIRAVSEVGNPTILATFTVVAAILPMAFVRGLMGPYMKPIPVGASVAMIFSLLVAFIVTPWAAIKILKHQDQKGEESKESRLDHWYRKIMEFLLEKKSSVVGFMGVIGILFILSSGFIYMKWVKVKMLPFDNKQEFQVLMDYPTTTSLEESQKKSTELSQRLLQNENVLAVQVFAGEAAPYSFSGMVKHTFLRNQDYQNDLQILLKDKGSRKESSHDIIEALRPIILDFGKAEGALTKVLEIPPGPPVLATMIAEIYGPTKEVRDQVAQEIEGIFKNEESVVDLDTTMRLGRERLFYGYDQYQGGLLGLHAQEIMMLGRLMFSETSVTSLSDVQSPEDVSVDLSLEHSARSGTNPFGDLRVPSFETGSVQAKLSLREPQLLKSETLFRKNLKPVSYVMSELSGAEEAPVYGILKLQSQIPYPIQTAEVPWNTSEPQVKWDGEWFITYEVFRDLGGAFAIVMILIYILVLGWFKSFTVPLIIMAPIPISLIGILPGHALVGSYFTATSMIGFIAGAGIIVRNSIILVDFIEHQLARGMTLKDSVISAGVLRFRPMLLTAAAVIVGSAVMLADPIFQGLAVSLIFGEIAATILSRFAVPALYYWMIGKGRYQAIHKD